MRNVKLALGLAAGSAAMTLAPLFAHADSGTDVQGKEIAEYAKQFIGTPYQWGGVSRQGLDCSGLVQTVFEHFHVTLPRTAALQAEIGEPVNRGQLAPGDLVFFNTTGSTYSHVGIYVGHGSFISATSSHGVRICELDSSYYWGQRFTVATNPLA